VNEKNAYFSDRNLDVPKRFSVQQSWRRDWEKGPQHRQQRKKPTSGRRTEKRGAHIAISANSTTAGEILKRRKPGYLN